MTRPKAYDPEHGYRYQILCRDPSVDREWEHCDYATDWKDRKHLLENYTQGYGHSFQFRTLQLPRKYWK